MKSRKDISEENQLTEVVVLQRFIPSYRVAVFEEIADQADFNITYVIGENVKGVKAGNAENLSTLNVIKLKSKGLNIFGRTLVWHLGLLITLIKLKPKVIVCEAESHFLGYLTAITYKILLLGRPRLLLWCFYILPGRENERGPIEITVRKFVRSFFCSFISYAEAGKTYLIKQGIDPSTVYVAHNVCDTKTFLDKSDDLKLTKRDAKVKLHLEDRFVVSFIGTLDPVKRPDLIIEIARTLRNENIHFLIIGDGPLRNQLQHEVQMSDLTNVTITGRVSENISLYYRATDYTILPGRGGIVISESMCFSTPVIVYQADGTERDLVVNDHTGVILPSGDIDEFSKCIKELAGDLDKCERMGINAKQLILSKMNTKNMASTVVQAVSPHIWKINGASK